MDDIMKIVKSLEESGLLIKSVKETIKNEPKEQKGEFIDMLTDKLGVTLLGNMLAGKKMVATGNDGVIQAGEVAIATS